MNGTYENGGAPEPRRYYGKYPGLVLDNAPEDPHLGRIMVQVPGILEEVPGQEGEQSDGADADEAAPGERERPIEILAKPCFPSGFFFIPETGAQIWVEFAAGDINEPLWSGAWYPEEGTPATSTDDPPTAQQKVIRTASGHVVQLDDTEDGEKVVVYHRTGSFISIDKEGTVVVGNHLGSTVILNAKDENVVVVDQHANSVQMTDEGITLVHGQGSAALHLGDGVVRAGADTIALEGGTVGLGASADAPTIMADPTFLSLWTAFAAHTHATGVGPSGPPLPPPPTLAPGSHLTSAVLVK